MRSRHLDEFRGTARFEILRRIGAGGMGVVYEAFDRERNQRVALKTIQHRDPSALYRFKNEFRNVADLAHPNLVRLYELFSEDGQWFFTMELVRGYSFLDFVSPARDLPEDDPLSLPSDSADLPASTLGDPTSGSIGTESFETVDGPPSPPPTEAETVGSTTRPGASGRTELDVGRGGLGAGDAASVAVSDGGPARRRTPPGPAPGSNGDRDDSFRQPHLMRLRSALGQIAEVLNELHAQGRLHRDIKPSNVMVTRGGRVVLLDFGLSIDVSSPVDPQTTAGRIVGTFTYMAPEQASGDPLSPASDWYSVGVMLYLALTGTLPFSGRQLDVLLAKQMAEPPPPSTRADGIPPDLEALCVGLLRRRPEDRPTGEEVLVRLGGSPAAARLGSRARPFVGRSAQLAALAEAYAELCRGRAVAALVHGRSGVGKTACVQRFLEDLVRRDGAVVLAGRCYEQESVAYKAFDSLIDALSRHLKRLGRAEADALMPREVAALARVFPVLRRVEAVAEAPRRGADIPDPQELRRRAFAALREMLTRIGDRHPLVLSIDDLQWGDLDSAALLTDLLRPPDPPVLMLLCCYRREDAASSACLRSLREAAPAVPTLRDRRDVPIEPLSPEEGLELALALIGRDGPAARAVAEMVAREAEGSPYFVYELVQYLKEGGEVVGGPTISSEVTLDTVLGRRIGRLPREARELLEVLALAGRPVRQAVACRAAGQGAEGFASLGLLRAQHLVRGTGPGTLDDVEPYHDRIRETVANRLLDPERRRRWHAGLARELEAGGDADPEALAVHFEGAGVAERAGHYYGQAADEAAEALAFDRAAKLYRRALELRPVGDAEGRRLRSRLGDALANSGLGVEAARAYQEAAAGAEQAELLELQRRAAYQFLISGHIDEGLGAFGTILGRVGMPLPSTPRRALMRLLLSRARLRLRGLRFRERDASEVPPGRLDLIDISRSVAVGISIVDVIRGSDYQTRSLLLALRAGEPLRICLALGWEAVHTACQGRPALRRTARLVAAAEALAGRLGHPHAAGMTSLSAGAARFLAGDYGAGLERLDRAEAIFREQCTGVVWERDTARIFALWSLFYLGRLAELGGRWRLASREARERGDRYLEATPGPFVGAAACLAEDDVDAARRTIEEAHGRWSQRGFHIQHLNHYYGSLYADLYAGEPRRAWDRYLRTAPLIGASLLLRIQQVRDDVYQQGGRCALAAAAASGEPEPLLRRAGRYANMLDRERVGWAVALARLIRAGVASVRGDVDRAERLLRESVALCDAAELGLFAAAARRRRGRLIGGDEGRSLVEQAEAWMRSQGVRNPGRMASCLAPGFPD